MGYGYYMNDPRFWRGVIDALDASWEATKKRFAKYDKLNEYIMEEKKTKKMTRAEAFEWLKCKKVYCYDGTNTLYYKLVKKLLACGCDYRGFMCPHNYSVSALAIDREGRVGHVPTEVFERYVNLPFEAISADDILSIEIVDGEDNIAEKKAFRQARDIMKWLREEQSPHTLMIIDGYHVELLDGVKAEVWKE